MTTPHKGPIQQPAPSRASAEGVGGSQATGSAPVARLDELDPQQLELRAGRTTASDPSPRSAPSRRGPRPRWLSGWGIVAIALNVYSTIYGAFAADFGLSSVSTAINIPILLQEMVLAVWLIARGFDPAALASGARGQE